MVAMWSRLVSLIVATHLVAVCFSFSCSSYMKTLKIVSGVRRDVSGCDELYRTRSSSSSSSSCIHLLPVTKARSSPLFLSRLAGGRNNENGESGTVASPPEIFPFSMRQALIEKAKMLDKNLEQGGERGSYSSVGWSNRLGTVLTPACIPGVYTGDRPFLWNKIDVGCRMTVIQLPKKNSSSSEESSQNKNKFDLWIHSPIGLDESLIEALEKLGTVKYVVSPNFEHLKFAPQWAKRYPEAFMWGCPGLIQKLGEEISFAGEIPCGFRPSSWEEGGNSKNSQQQMQNCWDLDEIQPLHIDTENLPITGKPFFNEVIYYHKSSKTLITTDFYWNYPQPDGVPNSHLRSSTSGGSSSNDDAGWELAPPVEKIPTGSKLWKFGMDQIYHPFYNKVMINSKTEYNKIVNLIVESDNWEIDTVIPAHGDIIRGRDLVRKTLKGFLALE